MDVNDVDLNLLVVFQKVWQERNVSMSAEHLGLSQSTVSNALRRLRKRFNDPLFLHTNIGMVPTPYASQLAEPINRALRILAAGIATKMRFDPATSQRQFTVAMTAVEEIVFLPRLLEHLERVAPNVSLRTVGVVAPQLRLGMESGAIDLAVGAFPELKAGYYQRRLCLQRYVCLLSRGRKLAGEQLTKEQFLTGRHLQVKAGGGAHVKIENALMTTDINCRAQLTLAHLLTVPFIIETTDLIATVPEALGIALAGRFAINVFAHPLNLPKLQVNEYYHHRYRNDPANQWLRTTFAELLER